MGGAKLLGEGSGGRLRPQWVQGKALVGGPGGQIPPEALGFKHLINKFPKKSKIKILFIHVVFFLKGGCTCTCGTPGYGLAEIASNYLYGKWTQVISTYGGNLYQPHFFLGD